MANKQRYKIIEEKDLNGNCEYTIWLHSPFLWIKDRWTPVSEYVGAKVYRKIKFKTKAEAQFYLYDRYGERITRVVDSGVV
jgi:hypothetical protein